ncbi:Vps36-domain-containing protein [Cryphonectria parasitica EP155]|uniref:Vacuolar protein-sorting-associated protein 36 n=1 Tax=Cryphonectria parasitica (strain ATCC 38755 / EP155) TaxID=660469 RepID=A0A9P4Y708_CRYP1|nr:Vps36-domain-containing protein [Cryphonectria parasitica EP155]KAF3767650.1 Vps36-domain-containing protein [Cryphonectria parasitica EP155]
MFLKQLDLTTALRPAYLPDEVLLFVQDNVGLYEGKYKLPNQQNGQVYLTSHRICYVDKADPRKHSLALDLKDVERYEFYAGFFKSSAKVTLIPKPTKRASLQSRSPAVPNGGSPRNGTASPVSRSDSPRRPAAADPSPAAGTATWVCTICSFSNPVPSNFDPATANAHTPLPPCLACGIKPALTHVLKAAISNATSRQVVVAPLPLRPRGLSGNNNNGLIAGDSNSPDARESSPPKTSSDPDASFQCPRCTFLNHPSLLSCEICGAPLISHDVPPGLGRPAQSTPTQDRTDSPGPVLSYGALSAMDNPESVKISFRGGGEKILYERLKGAITQRKWLLQGAPPVPSSNLLAVDANPGSTGPLQPRKKTVGIAGLEQRGLELRKNNELVIGSAFEDLEALMASAKEIVALAESFSRQTGGGSGGVSSEASAVLAESATQLGLVTTKDIAGSSNESLYLSELSRNLAEFLTDDARGVLRKAGGIISLVDLWAMFNRARGGVELVSPMDFEKAARLWEELRLPVRLRTFKSGVMVVQGKDRTDETTIKALLGWMQDLHSIPPDKEVPWDWQEFGRGVTSRDVAERFGWSIGVAEEELEMAEERGVLCREEGIEGLKFWENFIDTGEGRGRKKTEAQEAQRQIYKALRESGFI